MNTVDLDISAETTFPSSGDSNASFSLSLERTGEANPQPLEGILESAIENTDASFSPPLEGLGEATLTSYRMQLSKEAKTHLVSIAPLNLPQGETLDPAKEEAVYSFPLPLDLEVVGEGKIHTPPQAIPFAYLTANSKNYKFLKEMQDELKGNPTNAEKIIWNFFRNKKTGHKIRRQHVIDDFITDFVCLRKKLVIEIDGKIHLLQKEYDELRTKRLHELGYRVLRFSNEEVINNPESVALKTKEKLDSLIDQPLDPPISLAGTDASFPPPLEGIGEAIPQTQRETLETATEKLDASFPPLLEGLGEANPQPQGESLDPAMEKALASFPPPLERTGEANPQTLEGILESAIENTDASFPPPLQRTGEANSNLVEKTRGVQKLK